MKKIFILKKGKGSYGAQGMQLTPNDFYEMPTQEEIKLPNYSLAFSNNKIFLLRDGESFSNQDLSSLQANYTIDTSRNTLRLLRNGRVVNTVNFPESDGTPQQIAYRSGKISITRGNEITLHSQDVRWVTVTELDNDFTGYIRYRKTSGIVEVICAFKRNTQPTNTLNAIIFNLPDTIRPDTYVRRSAAFNFTGASGAITDPDKALVLIVPKGNISLIAMDAIDKAYQFSVTYYKG